jgi:drug/metabolite transporter (DMT)-like permease
MTHRPLAAALWMIGAIAAFTAMAIATRQINGVHDTFEILAYRSMIGWVIVVALAAAFRKLTDIRTDRLPSHVVRNVFHFTGQSLWFWAITMIPLAQVFALEFTSPIWVILLSPIFLGERLTRRKLVAAALGFAGVLIVAKPDFGHIEAGVLAAAAAAFFFASTNLMTKALTRGEPILSILFWLTLMQAVFGTVAMAVFGPITLPTLATLPDRHFGHHRAFLADHRIVAGTGQHRRPGRFRPPADHRRGRRSVLCRADRTLALSRGRADLPWYLDHPAEWHIWATGAVGH